MRAPGRMSDAQTLEFAHRELRAELPAVAAACLAWLHSPKARWVRIPLGLLLIAGGLLWFLPIVGIEMLPIGLLLLAQDAPFLRRPVGGFILFAVARWRRLKARSSARRRSRLRTRSGQRP